MLLDPSDLPQDAIPEEIKVGSKTMTVYKIPPLTQGPEVRRDTDGRVYMAYMYNSWLFVWYAGQATVQVYHGYIGGPDNWIMPWTFNMDTAWEGRTADGDLLVKRGKEWARKHEASRRPPA